MACECGHNHEPVVLFQGDSVTDVGRNYSDPNNLGLGYPMLVGAWLQARYPESGVKVINRGVSGDRVCSLKARWQEDCLDIEPTVVTILIGINDTWRKFDSNSPTSVEQFEADYRYILTETQDKTSAQIVLMEPFVLPYPDDRKAWREDLDPKIHVVRDLARDFDAALIPLDGLFAQAATRQDPTFWAADGVHPTLAGHGLIARAWLDTVETLL